LYFTSHKPIIHQFQNKSPHQSIHPIQHIHPPPIHLIDAISDHIPKNPTNLPTLQPPTTPLPPIFTLPPDIPPLLRLSLKTLHHIPLTYPYHPKNKQQPVFIIKSLHLNSPDLLAKKSI
ncbi:EcsC family protein, partial [Bacillus altitudinis]|uniref:EcsC family protein n=1 Tax=Bacillus altitudinis TaxID=293387 RepID=UPI001643880C